METWSFDVGERQLILRRVPVGESDFEGASRCALSDEADVIAQAHHHGVRAPKVVGKLAPADALGEGFVMERIAGEALPHRLFKDDKYKPALDILATQFAEQLALIHSIDLSGLPAALPEESTSAQIDGFENSLERYGAEIPIFDYAIQWLRHHTPEPRERVLLHGDFRMGNLLIDENGLAAVLDWELARIGDPAQDLGYLCTPSWRFGRYDKPVGGVGQIEVLLQAYHEKSGHEISPARLRFWLVFGTLQWGVICLTMMDIWRRGGDRSLERSIIGTRVSEVEIDLLLLLEDDAPAAASASIDMEEPSFEQGAGEPLLSELAIALTEWVENDILPDQEGRSLFNARVARNTLSIMERATAYGPRFAADARDRLRRLRLTEAQLRDGLRSGALDLSTDGILDHLRKTTIERLFIHQPKYAGLATAREKWGAGRQAK